MKGESRYFSFPPESPKVAMLHDLELYWFQGDDLEYILYKNVMQAFTNAWQRTI